MWQGQAAPRICVGSASLTGRLAVVRSMLFDLSLSRTRPDDPRESGSSENGGEPIGSLDGYTWHANRHTFASRLVMASVDLRTVQELGGWKTLKMVCSGTHILRRGISTKRSSD